MRKRWTKRKSGTRDAWRGLEAMGKTLERCRKLRRGSAAASDVTVQRRYGFTVGATPWRRQRLVTQALDWVCGESGAPVMRSLLRIAEEKRQEGISPVTSRWNLAARESP